MSALMTLIFWLTVVYAETSGSSRGNRVMLAIVYIGFLGIGVHMTVLVGILVAALFFILKSPTQSRAWFLTAVFVLIELYLVFALSSDPGEIPYYVPVSLVLLFYLFYIFTFERIPRGDIVTAVMLLVAVLPLAVNVMKKAAVPGGLVSDNPVLPTLIGQVCLAVLFAWALYPERAPASSLRLTRGPLRDYNSRGGPMAGVD